MRLVREHDDDADNPKDILDADGIGDVALLGRGSSADGSGSSSSDWKKELNDRLLETLLMEFYEDSIRDVQQFFESELKPPRGPTTRWGRRTSASPP